MPLPPFRQTSFPIWGPMKTPFHLLNPSSSYKIEKKKSSLATMMQAFYTRRSFNLPPQLKLLRLFASSLGGWGRFISLCDPIEACPILWVRLSLTSDDEDFAQHHNMTMFCKENVKLLSRDDVSSSTLPRLKTNFAWQIGVSMWGLRIYSTFLSRLKTKASKQLIM